MSCGSWDIKVSSVPFIPRFISIPYSNLFIPSIYLSWNCFLTTLTLRTQTTFTSNSQVYTSPIATISCRLTYIQILFPHSMPSLPQISIRTVITLVLSVKGITQDRSTTLDCWAPRALGVGLHCTHVVPCEHHSPLIQMIPAESSLHHTSQIMESFPPGINLLEVHSRFLLSPVPGAPEQRQSHKCIFLFPRQGSPTVPFPVHLQSGHFARPHHIDTTDTSLHLLQGDFTYMGHLFSVHVSHVWWPQQPGPTLQSQTHYFNASLQIMVLILNSSSFFILFSSHVL